MSEIFKKIGNVAQIKGGKRLPKGTSLQDDPTSHPYLRVVDFTDNGVDSFNIKYINDRTFQYISRYRIYSDEIYVSIAGTIGRVGVVPEWLSGANLTENAAKITGLSPEVDQFYLMYFLRSANGQGEIQNRKSGTSQPKLALYKIADIDFPCPPLNKQRAIASKLSAYDHLIQNNRRRIQLLEESARLLYREWFVHLRFPGHEHVKVVDGMPEGWEKVNIGDLLKFHIGGGWGKEEPTGNEIEPAHVIRGTDIGNLVNGSPESAQLRFHKESSLRSRRLQEYDIVFEVSGGSATQPVGRSLLITSEILESYDYSLICASFCKRLVPTDSDLNFYLFHFIEHSRNVSNLQVFQKQSASALQNFNFKAFLEHQMVPVPSHYLLQNFSEHSRPIHAQIARLSQQIRLLRQARDILLPRFMNGEVAV